MWAANLPFLNWASTIKLSIFPCSKNRAGLFVKNAFRKNIKKYISEFATLRI